MYNHKRAFAKAANSIGLPESKLLNILVTMRTLTEFGSARVAVRIGIPHRNSQYRFATKQLPSSIPKRVFPLYKTAQLTIDNTGIRLLHRKFKPSPIESRHPRVVFRLDEKNT